MNTKAEQLREYIADLKERGLSESEIAQHFGKRRGYIAQIRQGRVNVSEKQAQGMLEMLHDTHHSGRDRITIFKPLSELDKMTGVTKSHHFETPADKRSRDLLYRYSVEVEKMLAGEPYNLEQFRHKKIYTASKQGRVRITLELNENAIRRGFEESKLDRLYRYENIETPKGKGR
jgi:transcriptional regulator with XRE-family HTH domain